MAQLKVNDRIVQFKRDADSETGVVEGEQLQSEYQTLPPKPIVVLEYQDGSMEVVTGRHRLDLAKRNGRETIPAAILRKVDGWTPEKARTLDALDNILDEKGDDRDFIAFFRDSGIDRDTAEAKGLISRRKGRNAYAVAMQGETELIDAVMNGDVAADRAAAIAREAPKGEAHAPTVQRAVLKACLERPMTADDAGIMARSLMAGLEKQGDAQLPQQGDLFGADDSALLMAEAEARYAAGKRREALQVVQRLNAALSKGDALSLKGEFAQQLGITDTTDKVQIKQAIAALKERALQWENYFTDPVLYQEAHEAAVRQMAEATPLFEQADGSFVASPVNGKTPAAEETLPEELLDISSKPMPDVTKVYTTTYRVNTEDGNPHDMPTLVGERIVRFVEPKDHADELVTNLFTSSVDKDVVAYAQKAISETASANVKPNYVIISNSVSQRLSDAIRHLINVDVSDYSIAMKADAFIHVWKRHGAHGKHDHSMENVDDFGRIGYVVNSLDAMCYSVAADGKTPIFAQGYTEGNGKRVIALMARKQVNGHFMVSQVAPDTKKKIIFVTSSYKSKEVPKQENDAANATPVKHPKMALNTGTSSTPTIPQTDDNVKQNPVRPQGEGKSVAADGTPVVAGERLVLGGAYPYGERTMPLGGAPDSPAMQKVTRNSQFPSKPRCVEILRGLPLLLRFKEKR